MIEVVGNLWDFHRQNRWTAITTNGFVKGDGRAVMGRGTAAQCAKLYPYAPRQLGDAIMQYGNCVMQFMPDRKIVSFPVKYNWWEAASPRLIVRSAYELVEFVGDNDIDHIYLPRPGCGNGGLNWSDVFPLLQPIFDDRFTIVEYRP